VGFGHLPLDIFPRTFPLPDNSPLVSHGFPLFHHHHPTVYNTKRSTVNVYKIDSG